MGEASLMLRAWWRDHQAGPSFLAAAVLVGSVTPFAATMVAAWGDGPGLPLWALVPGTMAMLLAPCALSQLALFDVLTGPGLRQRYARLAWVLFVAGSSALACVPVASISGQTSLPLLTDLLVTFTFGVSARFGLASALVGASVDVLAFTYASRIAWIDPWRWVSGYMPWIGPLAFGLAATSVVAYAWDGPAWRFDSGGAGRRRRRRG